MDRSCAYSVPVVGNSIQNFVPPSFLYLLRFPKHCRAFTLAQFNRLPSALLERRYTRIPYEEQLCPCQSGSIKTIEHVLLNCCLYQNFFFMTKLPGSSNQFLYFLADCCKEITSKVARFCALTCLIRQKN